jgi:hypothetical protein
MSVPLNGACNVFFESIEGDDGTIHSVCGVAKAWHAHSSQPPGNEFHPLIFTS